MHGNIFPGKDRILLVDGHHLLYRCHHAKAAGVEGMLCAPDGTITHALYHALQSLSAFRRDISFDVGIVCFDDDGSDYRQALHPEYKAQREPMPDFLRKQLGMLKVFATAMGWTVFCKHGVEADDVLGTLAQQHGHREAVIVSGDKDLLQLLVDPKIVIYRAGFSGVYEKLTSTYVLHKYKVTPAQIPDYLAIAGDNADNFPGVPGVGPKGAAQILNEPGCETVEDALEYARAGHGKGSAWRKLLEHEQSALLCKKLATLQLNSFPQFYYGMENHRFRTPNASYIIPYSRRLAMRTIEGKYLPLLKQENGL